MTAAEMTEWTAYEQVYGPLLIQDRVDIGFAQVSLILARLFGEKDRRTLRDFLPSWWRELASGEAMMRMAEEK